MKYVLMARVAVLPMWLAERVCVPMPNFAKVLFLTVPIWLLVIGSVEIAIHHHGY